MKIVTFAIPCYNSEGYMRNCIESLLPGGEDVEIIIVDDGSGDGTAAIADEYAEKYPTIVRTIHQENGGHGAAVNTGLANATGLYYKVVDSDDWVDADAYRQVLDTLRKFVKEQTPVDMLLTNYVYEKVSEHHQRRMIYSLLFESDRITTWSEMKHNVKGFSILMHSVTYRTQMLRDCGLKLPEHTFYVDNLFVYEPLPYVKTIYYLNVDFYRHNLYLLVIRAKAGNGLPHMAVASVHNRSYHNLFLSCLLISHFFSFRLLLRVLLPGFLPAVPTADRNPSWPAPASSRSPRPSHTAATAGIPPAFPSGSTLS